MTNPLNELDEYGKVRIYRKKKVRKEIPEAEREHPASRPYHREQKALLRHSLMIDGLGEEDE